MRVAMRPRYYCDFCRKTGGSKFHLQKHESGCTKNPNRECGFCAASRERGGEPNRRLLKTLIVVLQECGLERLIEATNNCPGCVFAAIVQSRDQQIAAENENVAAGDSDNQPVEYDPFNPDVDLWKPKEGWIFKNEYDLQSEIKAFWSSLNERYDRY